MKYTSILFLLFVAASDAIATDVTDLYSARVTVLDRSDNELNRGAARALETVIVKLTGDSKSVQLAQARKLLPEAKRLLQQYVYEKDPAVPGEEPRLYLKVQFDPAQLHTLMAQHGLAVWGKERPDTLAWVIVDGTSGRQIVQPDDIEGFANVIQDRAQLRGIPLLFPLIDVGESNLISTAATLHELQQNILQGSVRYGTESVLIGYLKQVLPNIWESHWYLQVKKEEFSWTQEGEFLVLMMEESVDSLADALGRRFAGSGATTGSENVVLTVYGIRSIADYARAQQYLASIDAVTKLSVRQLQADTVIFSLRTDGGKAALAQSISFGNVLTEIGGAPDAYQLILH